MRITILPKTGPGKWSTGFILLFFLLWALIQILIASGQRGGETFFSNMALSIPGLIAVISGTLASITGILSLIKNKERSILVLLSTVIGLLVLVFVIGNIAFPEQ